MYELNPDIDTLVIERLKQEYQTRVNQELNAITRTKDPKNISTYLTDALFRDEKEWTAYAKAKHRSQALPQYTYDLIDRATCVTQPMIQALCRTAKAWSVKEAVSSKRRSYWYQQQFGSAQRLRDAYQTQIFGTLRLQQYLSVQQPTTKSLELQQKILSRIFEQDIQRSFHDYSSFLVGETAQIV